MPRRLLKHFGWVCCGAVGLLPCGGFQVATAIAAEECDLVGIKGCTDAIACRDFDTEIAVNDRFGQDVFGQQQGAKQFGAPVQRFDRRKELQRRCGA
jgi:hypothetical protein